MNRLEIINFETSKNFGRYIKSNAVKKFLAKYVNGGYPDISHASLEFNHLNGVKRLSQIANTQPVTRKSKILFRSTSIPEGMKIGDIYKSKSYIEETVGMKPVYPGWIERGLAKKGDLMPDRKFVLKEPELMATSKKANIKYKLSKKNKNASLHGSEVTGGAMSQIHGGLVHDYTGPKAMMVIKTKPGYRHLDINKIQKGKFREKSGWAQHEVLIPNTGVRIKSIKTKLDKKLLRDKYINKGITYPKDKPTPMYTHIYGEQL